MKCSPEYWGLGEISFCSLAVINRPPPELPPPGAFELLNYQAEENSIIQKLNPYKFPVLSSAPSQSFSEGSCKWSDLWPKDSKNLVHIELCDPEQITIPLGVRSSPTYFQGQICGSPLHQDLNIFLCLLISGNCEAVIQIVVYSYNKNIKEK